MNNDFEGSIDFWRLCDELTIVQAALLTVGCNPAGEDGNCELWKIHERPKGYEVAKTAISSALRNYLSYKDELLELESQTYHLQVDHLNAPDLVAENHDYLESLLCRSVEGVLVQQYKTDTNGNDIDAIEGSIDLHRSTIKVESLKRWVGFKGIKADFFFPVSVGSLDFLDTHNPRYAPKLAAAVRAWQAVTDAGKISPKQALDKWLREHAAQFGLINEKGDPIENAVEECSKVANWKPKGGATKTPS